MVDADPSLLRALLSKRIGNAVKFTAGRHDGQVEIGAGPRNGQVCPQVRDNAIGRCIVRRAPDRHGGMVWAEAGPGQGACFSVTLPRVV